MTTAHVNDNQRGGIVPRGLRRVDAARYIGISPTHFDKRQGPFLRRFNCSE